MNRTQTLISIITLMLSALVLITYAYIAIAFAGETIVVRGCSTAETFYDHSNGDYNDKRCFAI